ncbi:kinase activator [Histoplasma capsulatum var. duboisii H88]|uniref:Autophagy-related protein 17 n=2 Tax=Ajellomyces capsulatus TaxID=5037 RepID=F0UJJ8_AJEC8|nr:kinase activator [Histoplasma capsulatum H143]EGC46589.1 kinase activator [Histoplasma capsulatum var. duboisii H88]QSS57208.1 kinase activator [Histoplasma capsulatum var. duboisii H88]
MPPSPYQQPQLSPDQVGDMEASDSSQQLDLETLVSHLVAAKRSLSSIHHVWRANEIVTTARAALEESVIISSRTSFLRRGLDEQLKLLYGVRTEVERVAQRGRSEFAAALKEMDTVGERLTQTLDMLRDTPVESAFRPAGEESKSLYDFVDDRGVEDLQLLLKASIDNTNAAQAELDQSNRAFDNDIHSIHQALSKYRDAVKKRLSLSSSLSSSSPSASRVSIPSPSHVPELLRSLEAHARGMADLLESLVRHFDLCVTAVKHTEGGGAAARSITGDLPTGVGVGVTFGNEIQDDNGSRTLNAPLEPMTNAEYQEMISVLTKDASEAEDVVLEIQDRIAEMETTLERVLEQRDLLRSVYASTTDIFHRLSTLASSQLTDYIAQAHAFTRVWNEEQEHIQAGMAELVDLRNLYAGFLNAYDRLIMEVTRRKAVRLAVDKVLGETRRELDRLFEEDVRAREMFRTEYGDYLPSDIWPGLGRCPARVEFKRVSGGKLDVGGEAVHIPTEKQDAERKDEAEDSNGNAVEGAAADIPSTAGHDNTTPVIATGNDYGTGGIDDSIPQLPKHVVQQALARLKLQVKTVPGLSPS